MTPHQQEVETVDPTQVHLWQATLHPSPDEYAQLMRVLSEDEQERAGRFRFHRDRIRFVASHGWLRRLLGRYVGADPAALLFTTEGKDKPRLAPDRSSDVRFNMSHSQDLAVYAISRERDVGVDLEWVPTDLDVATVLPYFTPRERADILALPTDMQPPACIELWVRKEAVLKANGMGLTLDPAMIQVLGQGQVTLEGQTWSVHGFAVPPGYTAAVAVPGPHIHVPEMATDLARALATEP